MPYHFAGWFEGAADSPPPPLRKQSIQKRKAIGNIVLRRPGKAEHADDLFGYGTATACRNQGPRQRLCQIRGRGVRGRTYMASRSNF